jgi:hypothetical protein
MSELKVKVDNLNEAQLALFGQNFLHHFLAGGWGLLPKKDIESLVFFLLEQNGAIPHEGKLLVARDLRITEAKLNSLRRESHSKWHSISKVDRSSVMRNLLLNNLSDESLDRKKNYSDKKDGRVPIQFDHPIDKEDFIHHLKELGEIPVFERNRDVILVPFGDLLEIARKFGVKVAEPEKIAFEMERLFTKFSLGKFLTQPLNKITWFEVRMALNEAGAKFVESKIEGSSLFIEVFKEFIN